MTSPSRVGPRTRGVIAAVLVFVVDQASKLWLLDVFDLQERSPYAVAPGIDLVMAWNRGVSYSLLTSETDTGRYLLIALTLLASLALAIWLARGTTAPTGLALGLIIGGAFGNLVDRIRYGAVVDFVSLHAGSFRWYVFNGADCAITAGVVVLLLEWMLAHPAAHAPKSPRSSQKR